MIEFPITLTSGGSVCLPGHAFALALGYTKNRGVYRLAVSATGEWEGLAIRCFWHVPDGKNPASSLVVDGLVGVPASVTAQPGSGCITFEGSDGSRTVTSADLHYRVGANSGTEDGTLPEPGTPAWQQLVEQLDKSVAQVETYKAAAAQSAADAAASAEEAATAISSAIDATLSLSGKAADAKAAGDAIRGVKDDLAAEASRAKGEEQRLDDAIRALGIRAEEKQALLAVLRVLAAGNDAATAAYNALAELWGAEKLPDSPENNTTARLGLAALGRMILGRS